MSLPCLTGGGGGRAYGLDIDLVKPCSSSPSPRFSSNSSSSSSPSSTLSESSNTARVLSTKKPRAPRKRPNQTYNEAAALLSTIYPNVFSDSINPFRSSHRRSLSTLYDDIFTDPPELLLHQLPILADPSLLLPVSSQDQKFGQLTLLNPQPQPSISPPRANQRSSQNSEKQISPVFSDDDFDAESMLDEEFNLGIDSIMGCNNGDLVADSGSLHPNPYVGSLMGLRLAGRINKANLRRALRQTDDGEWWRFPRLAVRDIVPKLRSLSAMSTQTAVSPEKSKKKKKKVEEKHAVAKETESNSASSCEVNFKPFLGLKLNYDEVLKNWSDQAPPFEESPADVFARLSSIDLFPESRSGGGGGVREASVLRYKEKRRNRLFSKKIRYQVRKVNADRRPRMKGRFVKRPLSSSL